MKIGWHNWKKSITRKIVINMCNVYIRDHTYSTIDVDRFKQFLETNLISEVKYAPETNDCDDFSLDMFYVVSKRYPLAVHSLSTRSISSSVTTKKK